MATEGLALPASTRDLVKKTRCQERHPGLQLDKLSRVGGMEAQRAALDHVTGTLRDEALLRGLWDRRVATLNALKAERWRMTTRDALTLHLSRSGALENAGIALHPIYGFVYLPGSGLKGLTRAYAETVWAPAQASQEKAWRQIEEAFGWSPQSETHKFPQPKTGLPGWRPRDIKPQPAASVGRLVFHEAWPARWPRLIVDVVNNHHVKYYNGEDDPGDWENPTLVYFLAVGGGEQFEFALSDRRPEKGSNLLELACNWLKNALTLEGTGAKTAAGYGRFKPTEGETAVAISPDFDKAGFASARFDLKLVTPAFLAGADQKKEDCDLRPATLRGLLRWWWRTMHAAHLDRATLKRLETAVWGDAQAGSPVRVAVDYINGGQPEKYNKKAQQFQNLPKPEHGQKTTQGLFYASYGMDDSPKGGRWYRPPGTRWRVTLTARAGQFNDGSLTPQQLLGQAKAALWLLSQFGGAGSRSRKGFGAFQDIEVQGIGSKKDCIEAAVRFRANCDLEEGPAGPTDAPALEDAQSMEQQTAWNDPWYALDQAGMALQLFAKKSAAEDRIALGLPRRVGGERLKAGKIERHASPALFSLTAGQNGKLLIRLVTFPASRLPDKTKSKEVLHDFLSSALQAMKRRASQPSPKIAAPAQPQTDISSSLPKTGERVEAELLEEKTRKGGWKAKHLESGLQGPIQDHQNALDNAKPGQQVSLTVASVNAREMAFKWAEPPPPKKRATRNNQRGQRRGRR